MYIIILYIMIIHNIHSLKDGKYNDYLMLSFSMISISIKSQSRLIKNSIKINLNSALCEMAKKINCKTLTKYQFLTSNF